MGVYSTPFNQTLPLTDNFSNGYAFAVTESDVAASIYVSVRIEVAATSDIGIRVFDPFGNDAVFFENGTSDSGADLGAVGDLAIFDSTSSTPISAGSPPFSGTWEPANPVSSLLGNNPTGDWIVMVIGGAATYTVHEVELGINEGDVVYPDETDGFTVQLTPLIAPDGTVAEADLVEVTQYADLNVTHPRNAGRTADVTLSMYDPVVADLEPYEFALRVSYRRGEVVCWGQAWFDEDYAAGTITIHAQDPSLRLQHHYLRLGDDALNHGDTGELTADYIGVFTAVDAARNTTDQDTRGDPDLGIAEGLETDITLIDPIQVERGQECMDVIDQITQHRSGPDIDFRPLHTLPAANYVRLDCYGAEDGGLGRDLTAADPDNPTGPEVVFDYGVTGGQDNLENIVHRPGRPTTHAHVVDGLLARYSRGNVDGSNATGVFVDWISVDFMDVIASGSSLVDIAAGRVESLGKPPKFLELTLRPDAVQTWHYGHPSFPSNTGDFYMGDTVTVRAERGERSFAVSAKITEVQLSQAGWRAPAVTTLKVLPEVAGEPVDEEQ